MQGNSLKKLVSLHEGARRLGISRFTLAAYARKRLVATVLIGRRRLISEEEINRIIENGISCTAVQ